MPIRLPAVVAVAATVTMIAVTAQDRLPAEIVGNVEAAVKEILAVTGAPSASVAVVQGGVIAYARAFGQAQLDPPVAAAAEMRYSIGSISKQFTAAAILLLAEEKKLSLDDPVARWLPDLTRAREVTLRHLLSMTSGYQDFWPQDYVMRPMLKDVTADEILRGWARKPLDFDPGTKWQYSNTNYVIAGVIAERAAGVPLFEFLRRRIFTPLKMESVADTDRAALGSDDPARYLRYALGPPRPAPKEGRGWMFAAGELAMTASDLAKWNIALIDKTILRPASDRELTTETLLSNGAPTGYALGLNVAIIGGRRRLSHSGEVSGFTAANEVYPDDRAAVAVLTNLDATGASTQIASRIASAMFSASSRDADLAIERMRRIYEDLQRGQIDRRAFTDNANAYFSEQAIEDYQASLGALGRPQSFTQTAQSLRGGMVLRRFQIVYPQRRLNLTTFTTADGKIEQYQIAAVE